MATKKATSTAKKSATAPKPAAKAAAKKTPAKKSPAKKVAAAKPKAPPSHEEISRLAYYYWEQSGHYDGKHFEHWLRAEKELS